jgi:hypothetical protein
VLGKPHLQRSSHQQAAADPVRQGRAVELDAVPGEDLALPVERKVIAVFGDQDVSEQTGTQAFDPLARSAASVRTILQHRPARRQDRRP